jgi:hypothetical protein
MLFYTIFCSLAYYIDQYLLTMNNSHVCRMQMLFHGILMVQHKTVFAVLGLRFDNQNSVLVKVWLFFSIVGALSLTLE